jgi:type IV pilus assembly protein PilA
MVQKFRERSNGEGGFTLVELLVVMLILGLLAAIAIPSFFNQRDKAKDADAKAGVRTAQTAIESYATDNGGSYVGATAADLEAIESTLVDVDLNEPSGLADDAYTVSVTAEDTENVFSITRASTGDVSYTCVVGAPAKQAGCPTGGNWGD